MYSTVAVHRSITTTTTMSDTPNGDSTPVVELASMAIEETTPVKPANGDANSPAAASSPASGSFKDSFKAFSKFGDIKSDGKLITLTQSDKWMKQAKVIDKKLTTTDTAIHFKKLKSVRVNHEDYNKFLDDLAKTKKIELTEIKNKMANCGAPGSNVNRTPGKAAASTVDRLTDVKNYTGSHKERFDQTGKGKGISGRKELVDGSGYVSGYQHKDTYDKTH